MCKIIAIANQKGGVGKTTTTSNLGIGLAKQGKRVLLIDADSQGSLTASLGFQEPDKLEITLATVMAQNVIDIRNIYRDIARSKEKYVPVMSDFYDLLLQQPEEEAKDIALSLELFVNGSLNIFNHQTNVDVDNRFTVYGIRDLGTELSPITMLVMMEAISQRIVENGKKGKATWLYIDEFHVLLNSEYSAKYLQQLWKKVRKQGGLCTGITQNVVDLLQNYTATTMLANSEFVVLLKQANTDSSKMAETIGVSEAQLRLVTNSTSGMGLIKCGDVVIPFDNTIGKDTGLYRLYNTNIHEKIAENKL